MRLPGPGGMGLYEKKHKLLFSFVTNTVKMLCFVEPGKRTCVRGPVSVVGFICVTQGQQENLAIKLVLAKGYWEW